MLIMATIRTAYPEYYRNQSDIDDAVILWGDTMMYDFSVTLKAVKKFIQTDTKGFPPKIGQINAIAKDVLLAEIREKDMETAKLEMPKSEMPDWLRQKIDEIFKEVK